ncbi:MAG: hypothetical protein DI586_07585 [Micavibrio aeruginosavorus]|uniref:Uncharacterized protein n=1 Tax=Micavibrio aeruginosavorus TaxID=349221 RepID=A0A2W5FN03_9BACT|nr:MAG: hypothetical protein DI586_07585 [Micavibrio aeruginosavorus]
MWGKLLRGTSELALKAGSWVGSKFGSKGAAVETHAAETTVRTEAQKAASEQARELAEKQARRMADKDHVRQVLHEGDKVRQPGKILDQHGNPLSSHKPTQPPVTNTAPKTSAPPATHPSTGWSTLGSTIGNVIMNAPKAIKYPFIGGAIAYLGFINVPGAGTNDDGGLWGSAQRSSGRYGWDFMKGTAFYNEGAKLRQEIERDVVQTDAQKFEANRSLEAQKGLNSLVTGSAQAPTATGASSPTSITETFNIAQFAGNLKELGFKNNEIDTVMSAYNNSANGSDAKKLKEGLQSLSPEHRQVVVDSLPSVTP